MNLRLQMQPIQISHPTIIFLSSHLQTQLTCRNFIFLFVFANEEINIYICTRKLRYPTLTLLHVLHQAFENQSIIIINTIHKYYMDLVSRLNKYIAQNSLTASQVADRTGIPRPSLSQILSGRNRKISNEVIMRLHQSFPDLDMMWLLFGEKSSDGPSAVNAISPTRPERPTTHQTQRSLEFEPEDSPAPHPEPPADITSVKPEESHAAQTEYDSDKPSFYGNAHSRTEEPPLSTEPPVDTVSSVHTAEHESQPAGQTPLQANDAFRAFEKAAAHTHNIVDISPQTDNHYIAQEAEVEQVIVLYSDGTCRIYGNSRAAEPFHKKR